MPPQGLVERLSSDLASLLGLQCGIERSLVDATAAFDETRLQYLSPAILGSLSKNAIRNGQVVLGVTSLDLFVPVLTFVFGEAQLSGTAALVSVHRLADEFYGLPPDPQRLETRLVREALHEIGHTQGLRHCTNWRCVMASSHDVDRIDAKASAFCLDCSKAFGR